MKRFSARGPLVGMDLSAQRAAHDGYAALAPLYDEFVAHPAYRHWVLSIEATARQLGTHGVRLLDVGCGTGRSFAPLLGRGYLVTGCEPVTAMLEQARRRSPRRVRTACAVASDLPAGPFDLVLALNDVVNCLPNRCELRRTLAGIAERLATGAVFAFDVTPPAALARAFTGSRARLTARARFEWRPLPGDAAGRRQAQLRVRTARQPATVTLHRQRAVTAGELQDALAAAGLEVAAVRGSDNAGRLGPVAPGAFKHVYFTRRSDPRPRKEVPDAQRAQAPPQGRRHAGHRQDRLTGRLGAAVAAAPTAPAGGAGDGR